MDLSEIRLLRSNAKVWLVYAGYNRRFMEDFHKNNRVFLNIPGFNAAQATFEDEVLMRQHLAMSDAVAKYVRGKSPNSPSRNVKNYSSSPYIANSPDARRFSAELGNIERLFNEAKVGDMIMSPAKGQYDPFLIGEITSKWQKTDDLAVAKLLSEEVPTRRVRWLNVALTRRDFAPRTARRLVNRHAITKLDSSIYQDIFDTVYPNYSWGNRSKLDLFGNGYAGKDPMQPYEAAKLLKYIMSSVFAFQAQRIDEFNKLDVDDAIENFYDESQVEELAQNFNSPGKFTLIAGGSLTSILVAAGLMMATADPKGSVINQKAQVSQQVGDVMHGSGKAAAKTEMDNYLSSVEGSTWKPVQKNLGKSAQKTLGLSLDNSVEVARHKDELNAR